MDLCFARLFILAMIVANWHVKLCFISKKSLRPRRMKLTNCYFPSEGLSTCDTIARFLGRRIVLSRVACSLDSIIAKEIATMSRDGLRQLLWTLFQGSFWGVLDVPQSDPNRASWGCVWRGLEAMLRPKTLADFRPKVWPNFGQNFWSVFGQNLGRFSTQKMFTSGFLL